MKDLRTEKDLAVKAETLHMTAYLHVQEVADDDSPTGTAWECSGFYFEAGDSSGEPLDGGIFWGYPDALAAMYGELVTELPTAFECATWEEVDADEYEGMEELFTW